MQLGCPSRFGSICPSREWWPNEGSCPNIQSHRATWSWPGHPFLGPAAKDKWGPQIPTIFIERRCQGLLLITYFRVKSWVVKCKGQWRPCTPSLHSLVGRKSKVLDFWDRSVVSQQYVVPSGDTSKTQQIHLKTRLKGEEKNGQKIEINRKRLLKIRTNGKTVPNMEKTSTSNINSWQGSLWWSLAAWRCQHPGYAEAMRSQGVWS